ncbi:hypothetical protein SEA_COLT_184 [Mycobacterium phage Colt]|uniref:Uncharacterized protein n=1 Tax=Mycobacterium phage Cane17 TaxID=2301548 RepID=A0A346N8Y1_9CAUD|nr:hypothetical protein KHO59_gp142 [Mycobacterium phage Cane17]AXQ51766.1 hypothetical protein SEA_CANE17_184 [Mycobacterium phage Cane17]QAY14100.1 hypothetical protein SEA_COLT_184 [Mycobacterium phage Colt]
MIELALDKIVIDCGSGGVCTPQPWLDPVTVVQGPWWESIWAMIVGAVLLLAVIIAVAIVRWRHHDRLQREREAEEQTKRREIETPRANCPTCGTKVTLAARDKNQDLAWE